MRSLFFIALVLLSFTSYSQNVFKAVIKDKESLQPLPGSTAHVVNTSLRAGADEQGVLEIRNIPDGDHTIEISFVGYRKQSVMLKFPMAEGEMMNIFLEADEEELEEMVVTSTRSSRTISDISTRVEIIAGEELEEKGNMKPGDIRMLLNESTGIQTQQTSATSANASIRIQGLDGRYTQILKDGFPLYAGFSGGLGLLQTPPLDLKQVEVIKGSSSTLYGGGAIAGMVNLISRRPTDERQMNFLINGTTAKGLDISGFYSQKLGKVGVTLFAARNSNEAYDPAEIGLSAIPEFRRYTVNPKVFIELSKKDQLDVGLNLMTEERIGGDMLYLKGRGDATHTYFEQNDSRRFSTQLAFTHSFGEGVKLNLKNSISYFRRSLESPGYRFDGKQTGSFSEANVVAGNTSSEWIAGVNLWTDGFEEQPLISFPVRDYTQATWGVFVQNNKQLSEQFRLESGLRGDYVIDYGFALLPRLSLMYKPSATFSSRIGGGLGYKAPTIFTEESERVQYWHVLPVSSSSNKLENSYGFNWDFNYKTSLADDAVGISINQLFFYTYLDNPLLLTPLLEGEGAYQFVNRNGYIDSKGSETNVKIEYGDFKLFIGYTYTDTEIHDGVAGRQNPLTAKHRLNNVLMYELEESWKVGLEAYYFSPQQLSDGVGKEYWICGFMAEKIWERMSLFVNFENFLDARQTRFDTIYNGTITTPWFRDIYAPVDGFVVNGGVKLKL